MRLNRDLLGWGVFFITLGAVPLAVRGGLIGEDTVRRAWELWPLILVGIGLGLILRRTQAALVGGLVIALTFGLMAGSFVAVGAGVPFVGCGGSDTSGSAFTPQSGTLGGSASVKLALNCGELNVTPGAGSAWALSGSDEGGKGPKVSAGTGRLTIESEEFKGFGLRARDRWDVALPVDPSLSLEVSVNAGSGRLDLNGMHVPSISLSVNAGDGRIDMGNAAAVGSLSASANAGSISLTLPAASLSGSVTANAGSIELCVPDGVALTIRMSDNLLGSNNFGNRGLSRSGDSWTRTGSGSAAIDLSASANAGSITLNPEDGCDR